MPNCGVQTRQRTRIQGTYSPKESEIYMRFLVTGAAGFFGVNLCSKLLQNDGNEVIGVDNFITGRREYVKELENSRGFTFYEIDCRDSKTLLGQIREEIDVVFHLAANSDIAAAATNPRIDFDLGVGTTEAVLEFARQRKVGRFLFSSGSGVYGENLGDAFSEDSSTSRPVSTYGASKIACEALISAYSFMFGIKSTVFRFCNLVGSHQTHGVVFDFIQKLVATPDRLIVLGNGTQEKPYMDITDAISAMLIVLDSQGSDFDIFNVSNTDGVSVKWIAKEVTKLTGNANAEIVYGSSNRGWIADVPKYQMKTEKISKLGWEPRQNSSTAIHSSILANLKKD